MEAVEFVLRARDEATSRIRSVSGEVRGLEKGFNSMLRAGGAMTAIGLAGAGAAAGLAAMAIKLADTVEQLDNLSKQTDVDTTTLQVWQQVIKEGGGDTDVLGTALTRLNKAIGEGNPLIAKLGLAGLTTRDAFAKLMRVLSTTASDGERTKIAFDLLGRGVGALLPFVGDMTDGFDAMQKKMRDVGALVEGQSKADLKALDKVMDDLKTTTQGLGTALASFAVPALIRLAELAKGATTELVSLKRAMDDASQGKNKKPDTQNVGTAWASLMGGAWASSSPGRIFNTLFPPPPAELDIGGQTSPWGGKADALAEQARQAQAASDAAAAAARAAADAARQEAEDSAKRLAKELKAWGDLLNAPLTGPTLAPDDQRQLNWQNAGLKGGPMMPSAPTIGETQPGAAAQAAAQAALLAPDALEKWRAAVDEMSTSAAVLDDSLGALWDSLSGGFQMAAQGIISGAMSMSQALQSIFSSMVSALVAELAKLAALSVFKMILNLATGGLGSGLPTNAIKGVTAGVFNAGGVARGGAGPVTVNIMGLDAKGIEQAMNAPTGSMRQAVERTALAAAY